MTENKKGKKRQKQKQKKWKNTGGKNGKISGKAKKR